jgi:hypothetical protein
MRRSLWVVVLASLLLGLVTAPTLGAAAAPSSRGLSARDAEHRRIMEYWTPQRRANAIPRDVILGSRAAKPKPNATASSGVTGATWTGGGSVSKTTGKVFLTAGGVNYVCSGSAISGGQGNMVLTAGHCVHDGNKGPWVTNWAFYPGYQSGDRTNTAKGWTATDIFTSRDWAEKYQAFHNDAAVAVVHRPNANLSTSLATTIPGVSFTSPSVNSGSYFAFGYPAAKKYNGQILTYCANPVARGVDGDNGALSMVCGMTGGSSGGPWYRPVFNTSTGTGTINSVVSYGYGGGPYRNRLFGPVFDSVEQAVYNAGTSGDCGSSTTLVVCKDFNP